MSLSHFRAFCLPEPKKGSQSKKRGFFFKNGFISSIIIARKIIPHICSRPAAYIVGLSSRLPRNGTTSTMDMVVIELR